MYQEMQKRLSAYFGLQVAMDLQLLTLIIYQNIGSLHQHALAFVDATKSTSAGSSFTNG